MILQAAVTGDVQAFKTALAKAEKDPNVLRAMDDSGQRVLSIVAKLRPDLTSLLLKMGADPNLADKNMVTPLHWAVEYDNTDCIELLIRAGADLEAKDGLGETPLHWAAWTAHHRSALVLIQAGASMAASNHGGHRPLDLAIRQGHAQLISLLEGAAEKR